MRRILVDQADLTQAYIETVPHQTLNAGEARLRLQHFALTANNVTYAAAGFILKYWNFFPSGVDGKGLVPVWGVAEVTESHSDALTAGTRLYGYYPFAEELVITPKLDSHGITVDASAHRAELPVIYNQYVPVISKDTQKEYLRCLLQPLLATSYLLSDWLQDNAFFGAKQIIVGSASSKTGLGLCKYLAELSPCPIEIVGLTSASNVEFVQSLRACDTVVAYDDVETLPVIPSVYVDMAGNAEVKTRLHTHLADVLCHSSAVGTSHWDQFRPQQDLPGPKPEFFFAPAQIQKRRADWGPGMVEKAISAAWGRVAERSSDWLDVKVHRGLEAALPVYNNLARGKARPHDGHVIELG